MLGKFRLALAATAGLLAVSVAALAHHSYSMFDISRAVVVDGSVAKLEWTNPHVFVWAYVKKLDNSNEYDLYAFESGPIGFLARNGWSKDSLVAGEKVRVQYFPLRDGRPGGSFIRLVRADGSEMIGDQYSPGVAEELAKGKVPQ